MTLELLIAKYGLLAVFLGAAIEGETMVVLGGIFSHRHLMDFWTAAAAASTGSFLADQTLFLAGRYARHYPLIQKIAEKPTLQRAKQLLERYPAGFIFAFRFVYGFRTISPIAIGMSDVSTMKFVAINATAALIWGILFTTLGYLFGEAIEQMFGRLPLHRHVLIAAAGIIMLILFLLAYWKRRAA